MMWLCTCADPLRFMAGLETLASVDYSLCIKAGVHFTLCGGVPLYLHLVDPSSDCLQFGCRPSVDLGA